MSRGNPAGSGLSSRRVARIALFAAIGINAPLAISSAASIVNIYSFSGGEDGAIPDSGLTPDTQGNVYGVTGGGGDPACACGTIFKLDPSGRLSTLHRFAGGDQGAEPLTGLSVIRGAHYGGAQPTVFTIGTDGSNYTVLHNLTVEEGTVVAGLIQKAPGGGIFGLGAAGGQYIRGTLFYIDQNQRFAVVHNFRNGNDGTDPTSLIEDANGNLFGTTRFGGDLTMRRGGYGIIFEYVPKTRSYSVIYKFENGDDGNAPLLGGVEADGTIYGATEFSGKNDHPGALFTLTQVNGSYQLTVLSQIKSGIYGDSLSTTPALSPDGTLIGATNKGGTYTYRDGQYDIAYSPSPGAGLNGPYYVPKAYPNTAFDTSYQGGAACQYVNGCGYIFYTKR